MRLCVSWCLWLRCLTAVVAGLAPPGLSWGQAADLENLPALRDYEAHRITSADPTGGNTDCWHIAPGETRVLADIQGTGATFSHLTRTAGRLIARASNLKGPVPGGMTLV